MEVEKGYDLERSENDVFCLQLGAWCPKQSLLFPIAAVLKNLMLQFPLGEVITEYPGTLKLHS